MRIINENYKFSKKGRRLTKAKQMEKQFTTRQGLQTNHMFKLSVLISALFFVASIFAEIQEADGCGGVNVVCRRGRRGKAGFKGPSGPAGAQGQDGVPGIAGVDGPLATQSFLSLYRSGAGSIAAAALVQYSSTLYTTSGINDFTINFAGTGTEITFKTAGAYLISYTLDGKVSGGGSDKSSAVELFLNGVSVANSRYYSSKGQQMLVGQTLVNVSVTNKVLTVKNSSVNSITYNNQSGTNNNASLQIIRVGPAGLI